MNRVSAYSLRLACLCPLLLLLLAGPVLAQTATPTGASPPATTGTATTTASPTSTATSTPGAPAPATATRPSPTPRPTNTLQPLAPLPTAAATTPATATPAPGGGGGFLGGDGVAPLLLGGLLLLAGLSILGLLMLRRRRPARPARAAVRAATVPLPIGTEEVTGVLAPVYLELESDSSQRFAIHRTPFAIGRDPGNQLVIDESFPQWQTVSREHAIISRHERGYLIEDLGSQNGVRVNGRLTPKNLLRTGWQVTIGG
ncbi:MAG TPA: FHA domain-containing protein, partial [Promineifilum sp.]|nr:FHA domain-containing protein [Promineifilum sp.]